MRLHVTGTPTTPAEREGMIRVLGELCQRPVDVVAELDVDELVISTADSVSVWFYRESLVRDVRVCPRRLVIDMADQSSAMSFSYRHLLSDANFGRPPLECLHFVRFGPFTCASGGPLGLSASATTSDVASKTLALILDMVRVLRARVVRVDASIMWEDSVAAALAANSGVDAIEVAAHELSHDDAERVSRFCTTLVGCSPSDRSAIIESRGTLSALGRVSIFARIASNVALASVPGASCAVTYVDADTSLVDALRGASLPCVTHLSVSGRLSDDRDENTSANGFEAGRSLMTGAPCLRSLTLRMEATMDSALNLVWGVAEGAAKCLSLDTINIVIVSTTPPQRTRARRGRPSRGGPFGSVGSKDWCREIEVMRYLSSFVGGRRETRWSVTVIPPPGSAGSAGDAGRPCLTALAELAEHEVWF